MSFLTGHTGHAGQTATTTTSSTTKILTGPKKLALCTGINEYPDPRNRLLGCVNDANDLANYLSGTHNYSIQMLLDSKNTSINFKEILGNYITESKPGDKIVATYSGHGSNVQDINGDEDDGRDECICLYDRFLIDDEIRAMFKLLNPESSLVFISDSCHSGTVTRSFLNAISDSGERLIPRYMPPQDDNEARSINLTKLKTRMFYPEENMNEILIAGCLPTEYSYDARINGRNNGAMTSFALQILKNNSEITYNDFYSKLKLMLPSARYPQTPQLEGSTANKSKIMFK